ncbi:TetR/AcrR family transcriptional regulator [Kribbella sp. NBC_01245]|uniref:TetR/AcrR family transcriptional regulator n=1 Tax=Kribbella sp. NBC_01245 TaxID=2903578 RepID=UPI002E2840AC|nr:TetR/AcrR family transcriptional regulator [Kribbella sp. NBC_01245]
MSEARPLRADAARNREKILAAARQQITQSGPEVTMDAIAEAAAVAVGTLYRHFPTKTDLVGAILTEHLEQLANDIEAVADRASAATRDAPAIEEIQALIVRTLDLSARDRAVKAAAQGLGAAGFGEAQIERATKALERLIALAKAEGTLNPDVTVADFALILATAPLEQPPEVRERWLTLVLPGLRVDPRP